MSGDWIDGFSGEVDLPFTVIRVTVVYDLEFIDRMRAENSYITYKFRCGYHRKPGMKTSESYSY